MLIELFRSPVVHPQDVEAGVDQELGAFCEAPVFRPMAPRAQGDSALEQLHPLSRRGLIPAPHLVRFDPLARSTNLALVVSTLGCFVLHTVPLGTCQRSSGVLEVRRSRDQFDGELHAADPAEPEAAATVLASNIASIPVTRVGCWAASRSSRTCRWAGVSPFTGGRTAWF